jgi:hypothetical protein
MGKESRDGIEGGSGHRTDASDMIEACEMKTSGLEGLQ